MSSVVTSLLSEHVIMILELGPLHGIMPMHHSDLYLEACRDYKSGRDIESNFLNPESRSCQRMIYFHRGARLTLSPTAGSRQQEGGRRKMRAGSREQGEGSRVLGTRSR